MQECYKQCLFKEGGEDLVKEFIMSAVHGDEGGSTDVESWKGAGQVLQQLAGMYRPGWSLGGPWVVLGGPWVVLGWSWVVPGWSWVAPGWSLGGPWVAPGWSLGGPWAVPG